jgi:hypothetical protein
MTTTPRWLDAEETRAWLAYVEFSTLLSGHLNRRLRRDAGMTHADYTPRPTCPRFRRPP